MGCSIAMFECQRVAKPQKESNKDKKEKEQLLNYTGIKWERAML